MRRWARAERPDVALSYNSYAQILAARSLGIPAVTGMDYEHQPLNHVAFAPRSASCSPRPSPPRSFAEGRGPTR